MDIFTAQYRYTGPDRLDITISTKNTTWGRAFAPTWEIVRGHKNKVLSDEAYTRQYHRLMHESRVQHPAHWEYLFGLKKIVLVCFCTPGAFCHRVILANMIQSFTTINSTYHGEIQV